ncbi:MAG: O-methyltransferase, partial [Planctomycetota bacterium]|nr:O-methyltransferase [Planctomycetota bacterium]
MAPVLDAWLDDRSRDADPILAELETRAVERNFPAVGPQVGRLLDLLVRATGARRVAELGSGFGYSAYWFARAVGDGGTVQLTEGDETRLAEAKDALSRGGFVDRCRFHCGDALAWARDATPGWDILFCDVDKDGYPEVPDLAARLVPPGGLLIFDNVLWSGRFLDGARDDPAT